MIFAVVSLWLCGSLALLAVVLAARRRKGALARELHELRGALTSARLAVDLMPMLELDRPTICIAASSELERSYNSLGEFEDLLHARLVSLPARAAGLARRSPVEARAELDRLVLIWREAARRQDRSLDFEWIGEVPELAVNGPRRRFAEVVTNLLANAVRHGEGEIIVVARVRSDHLRIEVHDEGAGLAAPLATIARRPRFGRHGHGLGLATRAAQALGGSIRSAPSSAGACFVFTVPVVHGSPAAAGDALARPRTAGGE